MCLEHIVGMMECVELACKYCVSYHMHCRYSSRLSYAHTAAVISMVGYILGLGDRHGENILFDSTSGDCIHVDFNCLFNRVNKLLLCIPLWSIFVPKIHLPSVLFLQYT